MSKVESRWFPGHWDLPQRFVYGWRLADGRRWDAEDYDDEVVLSQISFVPTKALDITMIVADGASYHLTFPDVVDIQVDGAVHLGETNRGWEVLGTPMLQANHQRSDERLIYVVELSSALICFASRIGVLLD